MADFGVQVHVRDGSDVGPDIEGARVTAELVPVETGADGKATAEDFLLTVEKQGYWPEWKQPYHRPALGVDVPIALHRREPADLRRLVVRGLRTYLETGERFAWIGCSDFRLFEKFVKGEDIRPVLAQRQALGFRVVRVLGMMKNIVRFFPRDFPNYLPAIRPFHALAAEYELYSQWVVFADAQDIMPDEGQQRAFLWQVAAELDACPNSNLELVNEFQQNGVDPSRFEWPNVRIPCCRGSSIGDTVPPIPAWDWSEVHPRRDYKMISAVAETDLIINGADNFPGTKGCCRVGEPIGFAETPRPGSRSADPRVARLIALLAHSVGDGGCYHSDQGIQSELFTKNQLTCAEAWVAGARKGFEAIGE